VTSLVAIWEPGGRQHSIRNVREKVPQMVEKSSESMKKLIEWLGNVRDGLCGKD
jgi:hypothetical protein